MSTSFWSLFIGYLSAVIYTLFVLYMVTGLVGIHNIGQKFAEEEDDKIDPDLIDTSTHKELVKFSRKQIAGFTIKLIAGIVMMIVSILLVVGVKKEHHKFMAPWLILIFLSALIDIIEAIVNVQSAVSLIFGLLIAVIGLAMWYPIYRHYKKIKNGHCPQSSLESSSKKCMINPPTAPLYDHVNALPCAPPAAEFTHATIEAPASQDSE